MSLSRTQVSQLYVTMFGIASDGNGSNYWMSNQSDMTTASNIMLETEAAKDYLGSTLNNNKAFIENIYLNAFCTTYEEDTEGVDYWVDQLSSGKSKGEVVHAIIVAAQNSVNAGAAQDRFNNKVTVSNYVAEKINSCTDFDTFKDYIHDVTDDPSSMVIVKADIDTASGDSSEMSLSRTQVSQLYVTMFGIASDGNGSNYWMSNQSDMTTASNIMLETEAAKDYLGSTLNNNKAFIENIYLNAFCTTYEEDTEGVDYWVDQLSSGKSKGEVVHAIIVAAQNSANAGAAQDRFNNKVTVSNYVAEKIVSCTNFNTFKNYIHDVTDDPSSMAIVKADIDTASGDSSGTSGVTLTGDASDDRLEGGAGNDTLIGNEGNDILRGGAGVDIMDGGDGDDTFIIVGDLSDGGKIDSLEDTEALGFPLTDLNGMDLNEDEDGSAEIIIGGEGDDTLYVYGTADLSNYDITGIEHVELRSKVLFRNDFLMVVEDVTGDGSSTIEIVSKTPGTPVELDLAVLKLENIGHIVLSGDVTLKVDSLDQLGGARILTGEGTIKAKSGILPDLEGYTLESSFHVENEDGSDVGGGDRVDAVTTTKTDGRIEGTDGDDYLIGTTLDEILVSGGG